MNDAASGPVNGLPRGQRTRELAPGGRLLLVAVAVLAAVGVFVVAGLSPSVAQAGCKDPPCIKEPDDKPPPTPQPPTTTTISDISPSFAWSGDTITLTGTGFTGATVSVKNMPATVMQRTVKHLTFTVPAIPATIVGPVTVPVEVSSPTGKASTSFTLSPTLQTSAHATFGVNAQFGQGHDGSASATASLDRSSGFMLSKVTVRNTQTWSSLTVNMSTAWLDSSGTVIGFTTPDTVTTSGVIWHWPSAEATETRDFSDVVGPNPGVAPSTRSARIILVRDHQAELLSTLSNAVAAGKTIVQVLSTLAPLIV